MPEKLFLTVRDVAARYSVSVTQVWRLVAQDALPKPIRISSRCTRWRIADLTTWDEKHFRSESILEMESLELDNKEGKTTNANHSSKGN